MEDPLTAFMYAVQVMNFLKTLVSRTLKARNDSDVDSSPEFYIESFDENEEHDHFNSFQQDVATENEMLSNEAI